MTARLITTPGTTHLLRHDGQPGEGGQSVAAVTACGREVTGYTGHHVSGSFTIECGNCRRSSAFAAAADQVWLDEHRQEIAQAEGYVRSRFFPPLPEAYGELAVRAVHAVNAGEPLRRFRVAHLEPQPKGTGDDGNVTAARLVEVLRLDHLIDDDPRLDEY